MVERVVLSGHLPTLKLSERSSFRTRAHPFEFGFMTIPRLNGLGVLISDCTRIRRKNNSAIQFPHYERHNVRENHVKKRSRIVCHTAD
jgi:hypothetical protein